MSVATYPLLPLPPAAGCTYGQYSYSGGQGNAIAIAENRNDLTRAIVTACCPTFNITSLNNNCLFACNIGANASMAPFDACLKAEISLFLNATNSTGMNATNYVVVYDATSGATRYKGAGMWAAVFAVVASAILIQGF